VQCALVAQQESPGEEKYIKADGTTVEKTCQCYTVVRK